MRGLAKKVCFRDVEYKSMREASKKTGVRYATVHAECTQKKQKAEEEIIRIAKALRRWQA